MLQYPRDMTIDVQKSHARLAVMHILLCHRVSSSQNILQRPSHRASSGPARCSGDPHSSCLATNLLGTETPPLTSCRESSGGGDIRLPSPLTSCRESSGSGDVRLHLSRLAVSLLEVETSGYPHSSRLVVNLLGVVVQLCGVPVVGTSLATFDCIILKFDPHPSLLTS